LDKIAFIEKYKTTEKFDSLLVVMGSIYMLGEILSEKNVKISCHFYGTGINFVYRLFHSTSS
jgi:hypothetical protein